MKQQEEEIKYIINSIKIVEDQISSFEENKSIFFRKRKLKMHDEKIKKLECIKMYLCKRLECKIANIKKDLS